MFAVIVAVAEYRMSYFVAGLTNDDPNITAPVYKQYHHAQYNKALPVSATGSVSFPKSSDMFRYVIIQQKSDTTKAICLAEVKVFLRGKVHRLFMSYYNDSVNNYISPTGTLFFAIRLDFVDRF